MTRIDVTCFLKLAANFLLVYDWMAGREGGTTFLKTLSNIFLAQWPFESSFYIAYMISTNFVTLIG